MDISKTIEKLVEAKNVTEKCAERSGEFAEWLCEQMQDHGINSLMGGKYFLKHMVCNVARRTELYMIRDDDHYNVDSEVRIECKRVGDGLESEYWYNDFSSPFMRPSKHDVLGFAADAEDLLTELAELAEKKAEFPATA